MQCLEEVVREGRLESHLFSRSWMLESQARRVQHLPRKFPRGVGCVDFITQDGVAEMMQMHSDLMRTSAVQDAFDQADSVARTQNAILCAGSAAVAGRHLHALSMNRMSPDGRIDHSSFVSGHSRDQRQVHFFDCPRGELLGKVAVCNVVFGDDQAAACLFIQPMNDARPLLPADARKPRTMMQKRVD